MERSEKTERRWRGVAEMLRREQEEEKEEVLGVRPEVDSQEELEVSDTEDEGERCLIAACRKGMADVSYMCVSVCGRDDLA